MAEQLKEQIQDILTNDEKLQNFVDQYFDAVDTDGSGEIDRKELKKCLSAMAAEAGDHTPTSNQISKSMENLDTDGDNKVNKSEFKQVAQDYLTNLLAQI